MWEDNTLIEPLFDSKHKDVKNYARFYTHGLSDVANAHITGKPRDNEVIEQFSVIGGCSALDSLVGHILGILHRVPTLRTRCSIRCDSDMDTTCVLRYWLDLASLAKAEASSLVALSSWVTTQPYLVALEIMSPL